MSAGHGLVARHDQMATIHVLSHVPEHAPRADDPHYHLFEQAKARLKRQGLWKCVIGDDLCSGPVELHHSHIEFSEVNNMDPAKVAEAFGMHFADDNEFQAWIEGPGNLEPLCATHHRTHLGVHVLPGPFWEPLRYRRSGAPPPAEFVAAKDWEAGA